MDRFFRFSDYDIWAYLSSGILVIAAWDFAFGTNWVLRADWSVADGTIILFAAYILGHILATPSSWLLEHLLVGRILHSPSVNLFTDSQTGFRKYLQQTILGGFYKPLDEGLRNKIIERAGASSVLGEPLFWCAYPVAKRDPTAASRMSVFLNLYGFCRNIAFVALLSAMFSLGAIFKALSASQSAFSLDWLWEGTIISLGCGVLMFHRFLKFYRLYAVEVFVSYAESEVQSDAS